MPWVANRVAWTLWAMAAGMDIVAMPETVLIGWGKRKRTWTVMTAKECLIEQQFVLVV